MVTSADFLTLSYSDDLTWAGIAYGLRSLPYFYSQRCENIPERLRQIVAYKGVELAFKRYLVAREIPHEVWGSAQFANPEDCLLNLGGWRCALSTSLLLEKNRIRLAHQSPQTLLQAQTVIPAEQVPGLPQVRNWIYVFAFLTALITGTRQRVEQAVKAGQHVHLIHSLPTNVSRSRDGNPIGKVTLKCDTTEPVEVTLGGQNIKGEFQTTRLMLIPRERVEALVNFQTLSYLQVAKWPDGVIGVHIPTWEEPYLISSSQWANIWVYGMRMVFVGYLQGETFARKAKRLPSGNRIFSGQRTQTENLTLPVHELRPLKELFSRTREWSNKA